jgi:hypothetical protein
MFTLIVIFFSNRPPAPPHSARSIFVTQDEEERRRLDRVFGLERAKSSQRIMRITEEHEQVLANRMAEAGLLR